MSESPTPPGVEESVLEGKLTVSICNRIDVGNYQSISPMLSLSRTLQPGESVMAAAKSMRRQLAPVYGMLILQDLATLENMKSEGIENFAKRLIQEFYAQQ